MVVGHYPLANKICIVTGGGSGINLAFVKLALSQNCKCLVADLELTPEAQTLLSASPKNLAFAHCDVTNWSQLTSLPLKLKDFFGPTSVADIWVAGAGIFDGSSFAYDSQPDEAQGYEVMRINADHPIKLTRIAMRSSLAADQPCVVLIVASLAGVYGQYASAIYCASKHAVVGFTKSMAQADVDENVKVVCILPGMVTTPLWTGKAARRENLQFAYDGGQCLGVEEVAAGMREMIEDGVRWVGGSLMGIEKGNLRQRLESRQAMEIVGEEMERWAENAYRPIREVFGRERNGGVSKW